MTTIISSNKSPSHNLLTINEHFQPLNSNENFKNIKNNIIKNHNQEITVEGKYECKSNDYSKVTSGVKRQSSEFYDPSTNIILNKSSIEILQKAKKLVQKAITNKTIFSIYGPYEKLRCILRERGWVEKRNNEKREHSTFMSVKHLDMKSIPSIYGDFANENIDDDKDSSLEKENNSHAVHKIASQFVSDCVPDFIWCLKLSQIDFLTIKPYQLINHFRKTGSFTTKIGLIKSFNYLRWYEKNPDEVFPRSYIISDEDEKKAFLNDYYLTACLSLMRITAESEDVSKNTDYNAEEEIEIDINNSKYQFKKDTSVVHCNKESMEFPNMIDRRYPEMAINYCQLYLKNLTKKDLDSRDVIFCSSKKWEDFFLNFWNVTHEGYGIQCPDNIRNQCKDLCKHFEKIYDQYNLNGTKNIWIVKPGAKSRGRGISCISKFSEFNDTVRSSSEILIVQKYIERPLLVYNTKFDIRQWFLVTSWSPLTIWWYKDSYIRFCSQQFTLFNFNEAIHLSNNSIQHKYTNGVRSKNLPDNNMWTWESLESYLNENGYLNGWEKSILPSMKNIIIDILLCSQEEIEDRKNSYELYGADFMVTENDLKTWLLEINSSPCMAPSTDITARLTKSVLEDIVKVVIDYPNDTYCDTGQFELLYRQAPFSKSIIDSSNELSIIGSSIRKPIIYSRSISQEHIIKNRKPLNDDNGMLKYKLKQVIENSEITQDKNNKINDVSKKLYNRDSIKLTEDIKGFPKCIINSHLNQKIEQKLNTQNNTVNSHKLSLNQMNNLKTGTFRKKSIVCSDEHEENNLPRIKSEIVKSYDRLPFKIKKPINDRYSKIGYSFENILTNKINLLRTSEPSSNKRLDQIIKAYMPHMGN